ncbi:protein translocase subunit SecD [bacterium]|nr:protein translocase subunit SecD [bacterium]
MNAGNVKARALALAALTLAALVYLAPTWAPSWLKLPDAIAKNPIRLGLDLRGGTHLLFDVEVDKAVDNALGRMGEELKRELAADKIDVKGFEAADGNLTVHLANADQRTAFEDAVRRRFPSLEVQSSPDGASLADVVFSPSIKEREQIKQFALDQSLETIRNRIDQFGVSEPIIQKQGKEEIVVQLPGVQDPQRAKQLIGKTAVLEFRLVAEKSGPDTETVPAANPVEGRADYLLEKKVLMSGGAVGDARVRPGTQIEGPYVELMLNDAGARTFEQVTAENVGRNLAIVLDGKVASAPVIREKISGGRASISGQFDIKEARDLAIVLRAGALPAPIKIIEERTVGPSLGRDSIRKGVISLLVGGLAVIAFMLFYYKGAGLVADLALILNVLFLLAAFGLFGATLTLPGIAGIVLTMGMAVDANVLINERIREELLLGKTPRAALEAGYERAWAAIRDSNITTFVSGLILFQFGTGPVRGFAVTLCLGILTTILTAVFATRIYYDWRLSKGNLASISV